MGGDVGRRNSQGRALLEEDQISGNKMQNTCANSYTVCIDWMTVDSNHLLCHATKRVHDEIPRNEPESGSPTRLTCVRTNYLILCKLVLFMPSAGENPVHVEGF